MKKEERIFNSPVGMKDILPQEGFLRQTIEDKAKEIFQIYGYSPITTPILEDSGLFNRSLGKYTDIVTKQMFLVDHRQQKQIFCLRPEATSAIVRAYLENNLHKISPFLKLYYIGPMFRAERPQKGRLRQFYHIGVEALGSSSPFLDVEIISLADRLLKEFKISGFQIKINSLGCFNDRSKLKKILEGRLKDKLKKLCLDCKKRYRANVFRILDCKNEECKEAAKNLNLSHEEYLCDSCLEHWTVVKRNLDSLNIKYLISLELVRGLDYYTQTVFEISHPDLGAQDAIGAGGRYDRLISELGGPELGAVGFAFGVERLLLAFNPKPQFDIQVKVFIAVLGEEAKKEGFALLNRLRYEGISCDMDYEEKSLKGQMRRANDLKAKLVVLLGDNELKKQMVTLKDMASGNQEEISFQGITEEIRKRL